MTIDDASSGAPWQALVQIGDISVDQHWVRTPSGSMPTTQVTWAVQEQTRVEQVIPTYAIVLAVVTSLMTCFLGLLFLLIKEPRMSRWLQITAQGPVFAHSTFLPASLPEAAADIYARVDYARSLAAGTPA